MDEETETKVPSSSKIESLKSDETQESYFRKTPRRSDNNTPMKIDLSSLKAEVYALEQKRNVLQSEVARVERNSVSVGELRHLKAYVSHSQSITEAPIISEKLHDLSSISHANRFLRSQIKEFETSIDSEKTRRDGILSTQNIIKEAQNLEPVQFDYKSPESKNLQQLNRDIDSLNSHLSYISNVLSTTIVPPVPTQTAHSIISSVIEAYNQKTELALLETQKTKGQLSNAKLQYQQASQLLNETQIQLQNLQNEYSEKQKVLTSELEIAQNRQNAENENHLQEIKKLDTSIHRLQTRLSSSKERTYTLIREIRDIPDVHDIPSPQLQYSEEQFSSTSSDREQDIVDEHISLVLQKTALQKEIEMLRDEYQEKKDQAKLKQEKLKYEIGQLRKRIVVNNHNSGLILPFDPDQE